MNEWISVKDQLPKCDEIVIVFHKNRKQYICIYDNYTDSLQGVSDFYLANVNFGDFGKYKIGSSDHYGSGYGEITHWMPLPDVPK